MRYLNALLVLSSVCAVSMAVAQNERATDREQANAFFARLDALVNSHNRSASFQPLFAPTFYAVDKNGRRMGLTSYKERFLGLSGDRMAIRIKSTVKNVQLQNAELVVWIEQRLSYRENDGGRWVPYVRTSRFAYNLVPRANGWAIGSVQQLLENEPWSFKTSR